MRKTHKILGKVKQYCDEKDIKYVETNDGMDFRIISIWKSEKSGYRGLNKINGIEIRLNTQKEIINYIRYYYK